MKYLKFLFLFILVTALFSCNKDVDERDHFVGTYIGYRSSYFYDIWNMEAAYSTSNAVIYVNKSPMESHVTFHFETENGSQDSREYPFKDGTFKTYDNGGFVRFEGDSIKVRLQPGQSGNYSTYFGKKL